MSVVFDIGGTNIRLGVISCQKQLKYFKQVKTPKTLKRFKKEISELLKPANIQKELKVKKYLGVSLAGWIDEKNNKVISSPNIPYLKNIYLKEIFPWEKDVNIYLENDANAAALAESQFGKGKNCNNFVFLTIGTGIGAGIIINRRLYKGLGLAGEIGHTQIVFNGEKCNCGNYGCLETLSSGRVLDKYYIKLLKSNPKAKAEGIFDLAQQGNKKAIEIVFRFISGLGVSIFNLIYLLHPDLIVLGGGLFLSNKRYILPVLKKYVNLKLRSSLYKKTKIVPTSLGERASLIGASLLKAKK
ncbi:ROK family protein [bacterium]|nr:ROK family protein [bacterium]